jgi:uncharacterized spore protein YtfJ
LRDAPMPGEPVGQRLDRFASQSGPVKHPSFHQLIAFRDARARGFVPTTADDGVRNIAVIDACDRAAGLEPRPPQSDPQSVESKGVATDPNELMQQARDALTVKRVFGEPHEKDGMTVIPAASIRVAPVADEEWRNAGREGSESGSGGGFGLTAKPAGVYVIDGNKARWQPTDDANRVILGARSSRQCCGPWWVVC